MKFAECQKGGGSIFNGDESIMYSGIVLIIAIKSKNKI